MESIIADSEFIVALVKRLNQRHSDKGSMYDKQTTIRFLESKFPHLSDDLHDEAFEGLLHVQMNVFSRYAQSVIDSGDKERWEQITKAFLEVRSDCQLDVLNALNVSFLEHLHFGDGKQQRSWAYSAMPQQMRKAWKQMEAYNQKLHSS